VIRYLCGFYCPMCGWEFDVVFLNESPFETAECQSCGWVALMDVVKEGENDGGKE